MALARNVNSLRCTACQRWLLSAFLPETTSNLSQKRTRTAPRQQQRRGFRAVGLQLNHLAPDEETDKVSEQPEVFTPKPAQDAEAEGSSHDTNETPSEKPWYIQVQETQFRDLNPIAARQVLPEIPPDPPPILEGLLNHLSIDIGLDYLSLLDLRSVDPPPALGAKLIMIFGTARSEKHLNVSADRFCRWLRTDHKLSPYADGLLGRNELKLKMRRKMRRSRMLSAAGATETIGHDDGITTGWVCVNVGTVDEGSVVDEELGDGVVGFGRRSSGTNIVVQMMTEDKRGELDLEGLWQGVLKGSLRRQEKITNTTSSPQLDPPTSSSVDSLNVPGSAQISSRNPPSLSQQQVRAFHATTKRFSPDVQRETSQAPDPNELEPHLVADQTEPAMEDAFSHLSSSAIPTLALRTHLKYLSQLSTSAALEALGNDESDKDSTSFLRTFYAHIPTLRDAQHWQAVLALHAHALHLAHPSYTQAGHVKLFREMLASAAFIPVQTFEQSLNAILSSAHVPGGGERTPFKKSPQEMTTLEREKAKNNRSKPLHSGHENKSVYQRAQLNALRSSLGISFELLEYMEAYGYDICTENILVSIHNAINAPRFSEHGFMESATPVTKEQISGLHHRYRQTLEMLYPDFPSIPRKIVVALLETYPRSGQWQGFWKLWSAMARSAIRRDEELYVILFRSVADANNMAESRRALDEHVPAMELEQPPVKLEKHGELALAVARCLQVAGYNLRSQKAKWRAAWQKCVEGMEMVDKQRVMSEMQLSQAPDDDEASASAVQDDATGHNDTVSDEQDTEKLSREKSFESSEVLTGQRLGSI